MKQLFTFFLLLGGFGAFAQEDVNPNREQKIQALYIAYITKELNLSESDAQKFWPVHAQYDTEIKAVSSTDELARQQATLNIKKKYQERFTKILGQQRTNDFFIKDGEFRKKLVDRLRQMRQQRQGNNKKPFQRNQVAPAE
jgi:hypothetical protein